MRARRGQYIVVDASPDLVVVRLGVSSPEQRVAVVHDLRDLVRAFPVLTHPAHEAGP